jgi:paraquat-inducible protein B
VELLGMEVGEVLRVEGDLDPATADARTVVTVNLHPERIHLRSSSGDRSQLPQLPSPPQSPQALSQLLRELLPRGLRAQIRTANVLTAQRYVAIDMVPASRGAAVAVDWTRRPVTLPTFEGAPDGLVESITSLVTTMDKKMDKIPVEQLARESTLALREMRHTFEQTSRLIGHVDRDMAPRMTALMGQTEKTLGSVQRTLASDAPLQRDLRGALRDLSGAGHALRSLAEYLERHPESLIRGKQEDRR